ncbi:MAG: glycosyltransferase family 4 protein [Gemmataceae bacterium]
MKIAYITSGAAGMYCGSCMHDNTLVNALRGLGHDALLIPTYTPIRTDEPDASERRVFFGGINVYLEQKSWLFRHTPRFLDRMLNFNWLLRSVSPLAVRTKYSTLGALTVSMLQGTDGKQAKEVARLANWLATELQPDVVIFTNALLSGAIPAIRKSLRKPVLVTLQGDDIFLDALPKADRERCIELIRKNNAEVDAYIATSKYYADYMSGYLGVSREKIHVVHPGLNLDGHGGAKPPRDSLAIGYFARIAPEKGFHNLVDAFIVLAGRDSDRVKLRASGWLGANNRAYFEEQKRKLATAGLLTASNMWTAPRTRTRFASCNPSTSSPCRRRTMNRRALCAGGVGQRRARGATAARQFPGTGSKPPAADCSWNRTTRPNSLRVWPRF